MAYNERPITAIPEVAAYEAAKQELYAFKEANKEFFEQLTPLVDRYNSTLQMAEKAVRAKKVSCGEFSLTGRPAIVIDADKYYDEMGRDFFLEYGGKEKQVVVREAEAAPVDAAYAQGLIPKEVYDVIRQERPKYHKPAKMEMP